VSGAASRGRLFDAEGPRSSREARSQREGTAETDDSLRAGPGAEHDGFSPCPATPGVGLCAGMGASCGVGLASRLHAHRLWPVGWVPVSLDPMEGVPKVSACAATGSAVASIASSADAARGLQTLYHWSASRVWEQFAVLRVRARDLRTQLITARKES
jgi:hypothetical protein